MVEYVSVRHEGYDEYFGFTEEQVKKMCEDFRLPHKYEVFQKWYNGYVFGSTNVYNPWRLLYGPTGYQVLYFSPGAVVRSFDQLADNTVGRSIRPIRSGM